jgi:hypothetical protein
MAEPAHKPVVIILDVARGYGWQPGSSGYEMVANVHAARPEPDEP